jgi:plastocyanin
MRTKAWIGLVSSLFAAGALAACGDTPQKPTGASTGAGATAAGGTTSAGGTTTGGAAGSGASSGGTGGTGGGTTGTGGEPECVDAASCGISDDCHSYACDMGKCVEMFAAAGTKTKAQVIGDCKTNTCDGKGAIVSTNDDTDVFDDKNDCTTDSCSAGTTVNDPKSSGAPCASNGGKVCDGAKACVECVLDPNCASGVCGADHKCVPASCGDGVKNGMETDVDCGGPTCGKCNAGSVCMSAGDCVDGVCDPKTMKCAAASCGDGVKNGMETDVDCGGPTCPDCGPGKLCGSPLDCVSGVCSGNPLKCQMATCMDGVKNGAETDVDCGGGVCPACVADKACLVAGDCASGVCSGNPLKCQMPSCSDNVKNGNETGKDCGGGMCLPCANGLGCMKNADCSSMFCNAMQLCAAPNCMDGAKNGMETDVDCGGPTCAKCLDGKTCSVAADCAGGFCLGPPLCESSLNGCTLATAVDHTADAITTVTQSGFAYTPQCIKIKAGKQVKIDANYAGHPLSQGAVVNGTAFPEMGGPIPHTTTGTTATFTFPSAGSFGYYCDFHYGLGMYGAVFVVP